MRRILITGGAGFIGHHFVEHLVKWTRDKIVVLDRLNYASTWDRIRDLHVPPERLECLGGTFDQPIEGGLLEEIGDVDVILHLGAETHVDNSITNPEKFIQANVLGTHHILRLAEETGAHLFLFSTDEVFGPAPPGVAYKETDRHMPMNPYAATKSASESLVRAYGNTYGIKYTITRCMNVFGERQHPEKFIPLVIKRVLDGEKIGIHSNPEKTHAGSRFYIHARNVADAYLHLISLPEKAILNEDFHIVGEREVDNLTLAKMIASFVGKPLRYEMIDFHSSRPGHDLRYGLDGTKLANVGWKPAVEFERSLEKTVQWFLANRRWLR